MTQAEIISRVKERLDEAAATSLRFTDADITEYSLDGARFYVAKVGNQYATDTVTQAAYTLMYDLPCDFIQVERVLWDTGTEKIPLEPLHWRDLDDSTYQWQHTTDTRARCYFRFSARRIALWPMSATGGEDYIVHYQQDVPEDLTAVPVEDHECIVDYVIARLLLAQAKALDGAKAYGAYKAVVDGASRRRASLDRQWSMSGRSLR